MLTIRRATEADMAIYFEWRNDDVVRRSAFNMEMIPWNRHREWFQRKLTSAESYLYVLEHQGIPMAQVRFELDGSCAEINYSIDAGFRGKGLAAKLMRKAIEAFVGECPAASHLHAFVKTENRASNRVFEKAGFTRILTDSERSAHLYEFMMNEKRPAVTDDEI